MQQGGSKHGKRDSAGQAEQADDGAAQAVPDADGLPEKAPEVEVDAMKKI